MRKLESGEITKLRKMLERAEMSSNSGDSAAVFFPIKVEEKAEETQEGVLLLETKKSGSSSLIKPGVLVFGSHNSATTMGYASMEYSIPFDLSSHFRFMEIGSRLTEEERSFLFDLECHLVNQKNVIASFFFKQ